MSTATLTQLHTWLACLAMALGSGEITRREYDALRAAVLAELQRRAGAR